MSGNAEASKDAVVAAKAEMAAANPAAVSEIQDPAQRVKRIPMTMPQMRGEHVNIPGYYTQWIKGTPDRIEQARRAGFEFVTRADDVFLNSRDPAASAAKDGNTDLGNLVSVAQAEIGSDGQAIRGYLMKQRKEDREEDLQISQSRNDSVVDALTAAFDQGSTVGGGSEAAPSETPADRGARYVDRARSKIPEMFRRKPAKLS